MPAQNVVKSYVENSYYHIYNRGIEKRIIFQDDSDCAMFNFYLKLYLQPKFELIQEISLNPKRKIRFLHSNLSEEISLIAYSLMPNHFHLLVKQSTSDGITKLMRRLMTSYVMYFNSKYDRVGPLFQNKYKACIIDTDEYLLHLSRYIHLNPVNISSSINFNYYSSYDYYLGYKKSSWINCEDILLYFNKYTTSSPNNEYKKFVEDLNQRSEDILGPLLLEA